LAAPRGQGQPQQKDSQKQGKESALKKKQLRLIQPKKSHSNHSASFRVYFAYGPGTFGAHEESGKKKSLRGKKSRKIPLKTEKNTRNPDNKMRKEDGAGKKKF
jgi:hypothetical protein